MTTMRSLVSWHLMQLLLLAAWLPSFDAFIWSINNEYPAGQNKYTFSELYMFAPADTAVKGDAYVHLDLKVDIAAVEAQNVSMRAVVFHVPGSVAGDPVDTLQLNSMLQDLASEMELCSSRPYLGSTPSHVQMATFNTHSTELDGLGSPSAADSSAFQQAEEKKPRHQYAGNLDMKYHVKVSGLHSIVVEVCGVRNRGEGGDVSGVGGGIQDAATRVAGSIEFRNPYGYLSGIYYGYYPFEGCRAAVFFCFALFYAAALVRNWAHAMRIHFAIFAMVLLCLVESTTWFGAYGTMNDTGSPYCCPFPSPVVAALVLECGRRAAERALLLVLVSGHGVAKPSLSATEFLQVVGLAGLYLAAALMVDVRDVIEVNDLHRSSAHSVWWDMPVLIVDLCFLVWIYATLLNTMADLRDASQWAKLEMYSNLALVLGTFVGLVSAMTLILVLARGGAFKWPWELYWVQTVLWEVLNLGVMVAISILWAPSARAKLLATSSQLGVHDNDDEDDDDDVGNDGHSFQIEDGGLGRDKNGDGLNDFDDGDGDGQGMSISRFQMMLDERAGSEVEMAGTQQQGLNGEDLSDDFADEEDYSSLPLPAG